jgi:hypothetical protein
VRVGCIALDGGACVDLQRLQAEHLCAQT